MAGDARREQRLNEILAAYLEAVEAGQPPDRTALLRQHPDLAAELATFFANQDPIRPLAEPLRALLPAATAPIDVVAAAVTRDMPARNPHFGDYVLLEEVARGGMGVVYKARQTRLNRVVALKMILAGQLATAGAVRRFRAEAEAAASLDHPHIVPIYEVGEHQGQQYFSMKLIQGSGLDRQLARLRADPRAAVRLLAKVARAIQHAHERGILHRDLKPGNILLDAHDEPHVTDFGLAKRVKEDGQVSQSLSIVGTASYMAPEQAQSKGPLTVAADVYSLGAILYEMLTGRPPFKALTYLDTLIQVVRKAPDRPRSLNPRADPDLEKICLKCLAKPPEQRYASAGELAVELENWLAGEPLSVRPARGWERFRRWCRRNPLPAGLALLAAGVLLTAAAGAAVFAWHMAAAQAEITAARDAAFAEAVRAVQNADKERWARAAAEAARTAAEAARADADRERDRNRQLLAGQYLANGTGLLDADDLGGALVWFGEALRLEDGAAAEATHRARLATALRRYPRLLRMWFPDEMLQLARLSPDGDQVLTVGATGEVRLLDAATGKANGLLLPKRGAVSYATFSPDGRRLVVAGTGNTARVVDAASRQPLGKVLRHDGAATFAAFSADGTRVVTVGADKAARVWDAATGAPLTKALPHDNPVTLACLSPDGGRVATAGLNPQTNKGELYLWETGTGQLLGKQLAFSQRLRRIAFGADGRHVFVLIAPLIGRAFKAETGLPPLPVRGTVRGSGDNWLDPANGRVVVAANETAQLWDLLTAKPVPVVLPHRADVHDAAFSGDGTAVLTAAWDRTVRIWDAADGRPRTPPLRHGQRLVSAALSRDGRRLLTRDEDEVLRLWDVSPRETDAPPVVFKQQGIFRAFSPDGRKVLAGGKAGMRIVEVGKKKPTGETFPHAGPVAHGSFSPDGGRVLYVDREAMTVRDLQGRLLGPPYRLGGALRQAVFTPDGGLVALVDDQKGVEIWDPVAGKEVAKLVFKKLPPGAFAVGPGGRWVAIPGTKQTLRVFDTTTHKLALPVLKHDTAVVFAAFSADGKYLATACADGTARFWDLTTAAPATPPLPHGRQLQRLAFSRDGRRLATAGENGLVRVWETATGQAVTPLLRHGPAPSHLSFSPDGARLVTADKGRVRSWDLRPDGRPAADLVRLTHLLTGQQTHAAGEALVPLERDRLRRIWEELSAKYPNLTSPEGAQ
jgi:WD40 repeat protein/tRNA A-37 threonylcarbamoyl transferase component Bud32